MPQDAPATSHPHGMLADVRRKVFRYAFSRLHDRDLAEDATQEVMTRLVHQFRSREVPVDCPLDAWVIGVARHVVIDLARKTRREAGRALSEASFRSAAGAAPGGRIDVLLDLGAALSALTPGEQSLILACFIDGFTCAEIARKLRVPATRIRKRKERALEKLRAALVPATA